MAADPRAIAVSLFLDWENSNRILDQSLDRLSEKIDRLSLKDRRLFNAIVFGVFRHRATLDFLLTKNSSRSLKQIDLPVLYILRSAVFQLRFMDKIPDFAVIDTSVRLAKKYKNKKTSGFVNAVLRALTRESRHVEFPDEKKKPTLYISTFFSIPEWLAKKWIKTYGILKTKEICRYINTIPSMTLRTNELLCSRQQLYDRIKAECKDISLTPISPSGIRISGPVRPIHEWPAFQKGLFQIQDEAAQIVTQILNPKPGENVLDACAGLGGKTGHIAQLMKDTGSITAIDIENKKLDFLSEQCRLMGFQSISVKNLDLLNTTIKDFPDYFDRVLIDAPCSGLGVLGRNPDGKWNKNPNDIPRLAARQKKILNAGANLVKPGGSIVYAVCSCEKEENEDVILSFLSRRKDFSIDKAFKSDNLEPLLTKDGFLKTYPRSVEMDGFFAVRLRRKKK